MCPYRASLHRTVVCVHTEHRYIELFMKSASNSRSSSSYGGGYGGGNSAFGGGSSGGFGGGGNNMNNGFNSSGMSQQSYGSDGAYLILEH